MMGDFNADCNYFKASEYSSVSLATNSTFTWLIDGSADTTVSVSFAEVCFFVQIICICGMFFRILVSGLMFSFIEPYFEFAQNANSVVHYLQYLSQHYIANFTINKDYDQVQVFP